MSHTHEDYPSRDPFDPAHGGHEPAETHDASHGGVGKYIAVFVALCVLTGMSFFTYTDFWKQKIAPGAPQVAWAFMLAVACVKASLVILFFMHLKYEKSWKYVLTIPTAMMAIFLILMLVPDVGLRARHYSRERMLNAAEPEQAIEPHSDPLDHSPPTEH
jgi:cytochrome c oxidase subunit 4